MASESTFDPRVHLLTDVVDHYSRVKPDATYAEYPRSPLSYDEGFRQISYRQFANAINGMAKWLLDTLGHGNGEVLSYLGPNDLRYPALALGAIKAGYCLFVTSPRNSAAAHKSLFQDLKCTKLLVPNPRPAPVAIVLADQQLDLYEVPSLDDLLNVEYPHVKCAKTYPEAAREGLAIVHTSGSTGIPKPIIWTHETACAHVRKATLDAPAGFETAESWCRNKRHFVTLPPFHAGGLGYSLFIGIPVGMTLIFPISGAVPTATGLGEAMRKTSVEIALVPPSIVQELAQEPELLDYCSKNLEHMIYCGGDMPQVLGDKVASKIRLINMYGSSETLFLSTIYRKDDPARLKDWGYVQFNPCVGVEFRPVGDGQYELVQVRSPDKESHQLPFTIFPDTQEYATRDLWVRHPDENKADLWRWSSRADDVIVFLNGEKTNPISMEHHITATNPEVSAALVAGAQRFQASLIVELHEKNEIDPSQRARMVEKLWPSIEEANNVCPAHARIAKTHILFTHPDRPLPRAGKGTIQRAWALALYAPEIEALYADADKFSLKMEGEGAGPGRVTDPAIISNYIRQLIASTASLDENRLTGEANFFHLGMDSLQTITVARRLKQGFALPTLTPNLIYLHPSISQLTQAIIQLQQDDSISKELDEAVQMQERDSLLQEYLDQLSPATKHTVILTGSTGRLGTYLLDTLTKHPLVAHIHCLNRSPDGAVLQTLKMDQQGLQNPLPSSRVSFWKTNLSEANLGLSLDALHTLQATATLVIHNAWAVNFNLSLSSFKPHLSAVMNLLNFCSTAKQSPHFFFISSVSSVMGHQSDSETIPEAVITTNAPAPTGYANSKYLAEQIINRAAQTYSVPSSIVRVGQVAGSVQAAGEWNPTEWFPSLVLSSLHVGAVPESIGQVMGRIDWVPIDLLAEVLAELAVERNSERLVDVFHPVNPQPVTWETIRPLVVEAIHKHSGKRVESIPLHDWNKRVRNAMENASRGNQKLAHEELEQLLRKNPAAKLLDFFESISGDTRPGNILSTQLTLEKSQKLQSLHEVKPEWIDKWVSEWLR